MYRVFLKRVVDVFLAAAALAIAWPLLLVIAVAIRLEDGGPVIFRQRRIGRDGRPFWLLKFRSMPENTGDIPSDAAVHVKITRVGRIIRRTNADELPQLVNILRGEMSVVGPRPALPAQNELIALRRANGALRCAPGLTGLAQVNSYDQMPVSAKAEWDGRYAERITLARDVGIIVRTFRYLMSPPPTY
jgi:O-antigen biosynthesis protein WbqP